MERDDGYLSDFWPTYIACKRCKKNLVDTEFLANEFNENGVVRVRMEDMIEVCCLFY